MSRISLRHDEGWQDDDDTLESDAGTEGPCSTTAVPGGGAAPKAHKVSFVSDIEGNWEYLVRFVELSEALEKSGENADGSLELQLKDGW